MQLSALSIGGQCLLWLGFLGGAYATVLRQEIAESPWSTIPWGIYATFAVIGVVGVVMLRKLKADQRSASGESEAEFEAVLTSLRSVSEKAKQLAATIDDQTCEQVLEYIDEQCAPLLAEFADGRMLISNRFGTVVYAEVMTEFASGERYLNRAWSASADGYVDEVESCVKYADQFLAQALKILEKAAS